MLSPRITRAALVLSISAALASVGVLAPAQAASANSVVNARVCASNAPGTADCQAVRHDLIDPATGQRVQLNATSGFGSTAIRTAYGITGTGAPGTIIAIVDAYDATSAASDLATYRSTMGLPAISNSCTVSGTTIGTSGGPCFVKVGQSGSTTSLPRADAGWAQEIDLDIQMASTVCPNCSILLVEANSASFNDLNASVATAASFAGVKAISNSYGGSDISQTLEPAYNNAAAQGIAVTASTGDSGYGDSFPASSSNVIAVGGTSLTVNSSGVRTGETAWSGAGSGCSANNANPGWESTSCGSKKANADVSAVADPNTGVSVFYSGLWYVFGGTSVSSPIVGSWLALNSANWSSTGNAAQYVWTGPKWFDVTSGSNGSCGAPLCTAGTGWDGPTGLGSLPAAPVVIAATTTTSVTPASETSTYGASTSILATVTPSDTGTPTGSVKLTQGTSTLGTCTLAGTGATSCTVTFAATLPVGSYTLTAAYSGDANYSSSSASNALVITKATTNTTLSAPASANVGQAVTLSASVSPSSATGSVQFYDGGVAIGGPVNLSAGSASLSYPITTAGPHSITATYSGNANFSSSTSSAVSVSVSKGSTTTMVTAPASASLGQSVSISAAVAPSSATGTVQFYDGTTAIGTPVNVSAGSASVSYTFPTTGVHSVTATYSGDSNWSGSTSSAVSVSVAALSSTTTLSAPASATLGQAVTLSAVVAPGSATGSVQFYDGGLVIGAPVTVAAGAALLSYTFTTTGTHNVTATYSGDSNVSGSTSNAVSVSVTSLTTVPGVISSVTASPGNKIGTITASWTAPSSGGSAITGYVVKVYTSSGSLVSQSTVTGTSVRVNRLTSGALYYVTVAAQNAVGTQPVATKSNTVAAR